MKRSWLGLVFFISMASTIVLIVGGANKGFFNDRSIQQENEAIEESLKSTYYELGYTDGYIRKTLDNKESVVHIDRVLSKAREDYEKRKANDGHSKKNVQ